VVVIISDFCEKDPRKGEKEREINENEKRKSSEKKVRMDEKGVARLFPNGAFER
jgi:hypothetical protein